MKETVQVTREDREAAAALVPLCFGASALWQKNVLAGYYDDGEVVQAFARHRLSATSAPAGVEGWKLVPVEPTEDMLDAWSCVAGYSNDAELVCGYAAMVAAAPAPSGQEVVHCKTCGERMDSEGIPCADCAFSARTATPPASGVTVPEGMKAWNGGESAPEDWDGGRVLFRDGKTGAYLRKDGGCWSHRVVSPDDIIAYTPKPAALSTPSATPGEDRQRLALEAIKVVTATTKDAVAGLSRIMAIARSAGVDAPYSELMAKPEVALIVNEPRTNWRHLFEQPAECTIPPAGWRCTRKPRHDGPCAAVATATPGEEA